jgi:hypothetical protein
MLEEIARGRFAWMRVADLVDLGHDAAALLELYPEWVQFWELARGRAVTLTPLAAAELGVEIRDAFEGRRLRWDRCAAAFNPKMTTKRGEIAIPIPEWPPYSPSSPEPWCWCREELAEAAARAAELERRRPPPVLAGATILGVIVETQRPRKRRK